MICKLLAVCGALGLGTVLLLAQTGVSSADIQTVKAKLNQADPYFREVWSQVFTSRGLHFVPPRIVAFSNTPSSVCPDIKPGNGAYCPGDNTIYLDAAYLAKLMNETATHNKTDGDYAAIVVAAHEFGHQVDQQLGIKHNFDFLEEQRADCLAGAITLQARIDGHLDPDDLEEARYALTISGDPTTIRDIFTPDAHGSADQRRDSFNRGYYAGAATCVDELGKPAVPRAGNVIDASFVDRTRAGSGPSCLWLRGPSGLLISNISHSGPCELIYGGSKLPADFRVELMVRAETGRAGQCYGLVLGRPDSQKPLSSQYIFCVTPDGVYKLGTPNRSLYSLDKIYASGFHPDSGVRTGLKMVNHLVLDFHRTYNGTVVVCYLNDRFEEVDRALEAPQGSIGVYLDSPAMEVNVTTLRVSWLSQ